MSKQQTPKAAKSWQKFPSVFICCSKSNGFDIEIVHSHMTMIFTVRLSKTNIVIDLFLSIIFEMLS